MYANKIHIRLANTIVMIFIFGNMADMFFFNLVLKAWIVLIL